MTEEERAERALALAELGRALFGPDWILPMGKALGVSPRMAQYYALGRGRLPTLKMLAEIAQAAIERGDDIVLLDRVVTIRRFAVSHK